MKSWTDAMSLDRRSFEKLLNVKFLDKKITQDQMYELVRRWKVENAPINKKDVEDVFGK